MPRGRMGGRHGMSTEKAKDFKGTMKKLMGYLTQYKIGLLLVVEVELILIRSQRFSSD